MLHNVKLGETEPANQAATPCRVLEFTQVTKAVSSQTSTDMHVALRERLSPREYQVIRLRFGFDGQGYHSMEEVAKFLSLKEARVRQLEASALLKLRESSKKTHNIVPLR